MTKKQARATIEEYKDRTAYFAGEIKRESMYEMLRYSMRFGEAETQVILAALENAGAKFA